jgi:hypothetical protein
MATAAFSAVVLAFYDSAYMAFGGLCLVLTVPWMLLVRSRGEFLAIAAILVVFSGLIGPSLRRAAGSTNAARTVVSEAR